MSRDVRDLAVMYLDGEILATESCINRLAGIQNDAVNQEAQSDQIQRMRRKVEVWRYLRGLVP